MRNNTGQHIQRVQFNVKGEPTGRELILGELKQRIREVKPDPTGSSTPSPTRILVRS